MTPLRFTVQDVHVVIDAPAELMEQVTQLIRPDSSKIQQRRTQLTLTVHCSPTGSLRLSGGGAAISLTDTAMALTHVLSRLNAAVLDRMPYLGIHAGAIAVNGRTIAFPAASGTGKSTLVAGCLQAGADYVSDEALCIDWVSGQLRPYARPIALSADSCELLGLATNHPGESLFSPAALGATVASQPLRLTHLVLLDRSPAPIEEVSRGTGIVELLTRSFNHWHQPARAFELVHELVRDAAVWRMGRLAPTVSAGRILELATLD